MVDRNKVTRRSVIAGIASAVLPTTAPMHANQATPVATPEVFTGPAPIELGMGISIIDSRIIRTVEPYQFLLEIRNDSDNVLTSPTIGAIFPSAPADKDYAWAVPWHPLLLPGASTFAVGLLAGTGTLPNDASWKICNEDMDITNEQEKFLDQEWEIESSVEVVNKNALRISSQVINNGSTTIRNGELRGIVRDSSGRICGGVPPTNPFVIRPGEHATRIIGFNSSWPSPANPFLLCDDANDFFLSLDVQPRGPAVNQGCPAVMPWNR